MQDLGRISNWNWVLDEGPVHPGTCFEGFSRVDLG